MNMNPWIFHRSRSAPDLKGSTVTLLLAAAALVACSGDDGPIGLGSGGGEGMGAATASGGDPGVGGGIGSGGVVAGGASGSGGSPTGGASGGVLNPSGGAPSSGGDTGTGGDGSGGNSGSCDATGFHISGTKLLDSKCNEFVMRGVNYPYVWFKDSQATDAKLVDIAGVGSNAVRIVMATGGQWARTSGNEVSQLISWAKQNKMVALLEVHDSTGFPEQGPAEDPQNAVDYWLSSDIRAAIDGEEAYVLINIANEAFGNGANKDEDSTRWESFYTGAVAELRTAGLKHTLVVDAPNWGQDWQWIMRDGEGAQHIMHADPDKNVAFSVHMYQIFDQASVVQTYMDNFLSSGLPLIVGEFAADHGDSGDVAEGTILDEAMARGVGYLGWSWSGNGAGLESLDITQNFDVGSLSTWGGILINDPNGITASSTICTCFD